MEWGIDWKEVAKYNDRSQNVDNTAIHFRVPEKGKKFRGTGYSSQEGLCSMELELQSACLQRQDTSQCNETTILPNKLGQAAVVRFVEHETQHYTIVFCCFLYSMHKPCNPYKCVPTTRHKSVKEQ
jgi:hypothetical protein